MKMENEIKNGILTTMQDRYKSFRKGYTIDRSHEFMIGAMQMYLLLRPESEENGAWCPPDWMFGIMRGTDYRTGTEHFSKEE
tara:strand:- start:641 stop:886 length:246 start_codon:yes stop_codon:yes gene_type:complete